jgi:hypothetical protein
MIYSVGRMLTISEGQLPGGCEGRSAGARLGAPPEAGTTCDVVAHRLATGQSAIARLERDRPPASLNSIDRMAVAVGSDTAVISEQKRSA